MRNKILSFVAAIGIITAIIATGLIASCSLSGGNDATQAEEKVQNAKEELKEAKEDLKEEKKDERQDEAYLKEREQFRAECYHTIGYNEGRIAEIKLNMNKSDKDYAVKKQRIEELEQKNQALKTRLDQYDDNQTSEKWEQFKNEFRHDMEALGGALKGFFRDDKK